MRAIRAWFLRLGGSLARGRRDRDMADELASHLQMHVDDNLRAGMTPEEARRDAVLRLGGLDQAKEQYRERRTLPAIELTGQDVRFALRLMRRTPGFTLVAIATLALGIGANALMFGVVNALLLRPLPYAEPDRLVSVRTLGSAGQPWGTSPPDFYEYRRRTQTLEQLDAFYTRSSNLTGAGTDPERVQTLIVSPSFFTTLGVSPVLGRGFLAGEERWGSHRAVILTDALWKSRFGRDPRMLDASIAIDGVPHVIVGILPAGFSFLGIDAQLVVPMAFEAGDNMNSHSNYFLNMVGRLKRAASRDAAFGDLNGISNAIIERAPENTGTSIGVTSLRDALVGDVRRPILVLLGAVGFVLLIACANLANLLLARGAARQREMVIRTAVGATRARLVRQSLTESLLLSAVGGGAGLGLAYLSIQALNALSQSILPRAADVTVDAAVAAFTFVSSTATGAAFGVLPAMYTSAVDVNGGLRDGARTTTEGKGRRRLRTVLVVGEVALSLVLLAGAGLMAKSMYRLLNVDAGFETDGVLTMQINLPRRKYVDVALERQFSPLAYERSTRFFDDVIRRVRALPGVRAVGATNGLPLMGEIWGKNITFYDRPFPADVRSLPPIQYRVVTGDYFRALGIRILSGRAFADSDTASAPRVVIVNRELVRRYWNGVDPVGKIVSVNPPLELLPDRLVAEARRHGLPADFQVDRYTVVGVADDVRYGRLNSPALPLVYARYAQGSEGATDMFLTIRADRDPMMLVAAIREQIRQVDPDQPVASIRMLGDRVSASVAGPRLLMIVLGTFAGLALLLACVGIYGVMSYGIAQRTREIGIRMALGAGRADVLRSVLGQAVLLIVVGVTLGLLAAAFLTRVLRALLFEVSVTDPAVLAGIVAVLAVTGCLAAYLPARRATRVDPLVTLRDE